jgi:hypothetical protein
MEHRNSLILNGGPTFIFPLANNNSPLGPKNQEIPPGTSFEN